MKNSFNDFFNYIDDINNENTLNQKKTPNKIIAFSINILAIALLISGGYGLKYLENRENDIEESRIRQEELMTNSQNAALEIKDMIEDKQEEKVNGYRDFEKLKKENNDTVAWLYVPGVDIDMPIVQAKNNSYYLSHDFDKKKSTMGWAFADYNNTFPELSDNTIMYGHTYRETTIFSKLKRVLKKDWLNDKSKHIITFDTEKERLTFKVFSVYTIKETNDYLYISFETKEKYQKYLDRELERSIKDFNVNVTSDDKIITLSTCYMNEHNRLVLHAKLIGTE